MDKKIVRVSVKDLVNFGINKGSIDKGRASLMSDTAWEGSVFHSLFQKKMVSVHGSESFGKEVFVNDEISNDYVELKITGRIDGVLSDDSGTCIYEVKTTSRTISGIGMDEYPSHWAQAICYGYMYAKSEGLGSLVIRLLYINRELGEDRQFEKTYGFDELGSFFLDYANRYLEWTAGIRKWEIIRDGSIASLEFPFSSYRNGQRKMAEKAYVSIREGNRLFIQAPTGIGKTMGALFPAVKALGEGLVERIFYLTAKTVTAGIAIENQRKLCDSGLNLRTVVLTAKDKVCPKEKRNCDPDFCDRARDYYERSGNAVGALLKNQLMDRETIRKYADLYNICPFELSLDASLYADLIIGDYNYLFDPRVRLIRFFEDAGGDYCFLIDEAHNLVDRAREMYSCELAKEQILELKRETDPKWDDMKKGLEKVNKELSSLKKEYFGDSQGTAYESSGDMPAKLASAVRKCVSIMEAYLEYDMGEEYNKKFMDMYFNLLFFVKVSEMFDGRYAAFYIKNGSYLRVKLMCLDPSCLLSRAMDKGKASILFSATLEPASYYKNILGGRETDPFILLPSPFPKENLAVVIEGRVSTKYRDRDSSYDDIAFILRDSFSLKTGNYMVYFPSYKYLEDVLGIFEKISTGFEIMVQKPGMAENDREIFLERFERHGGNTLVAFAVMGGIFGEGIDLAGDRLSGVAVIGTGLPAVCPERELIKCYYDEINGQGFDYAYTYPGLNRVLQAAGRVIRSESDKGFVILIDSRFTGRKYLALYPLWWNPVCLEGNKPKAADCISRDLLL
ncbi:MAG: ATP-dependent DNA helicase [Clostridia bacterium]|nr:ATP-dependent DNA helicase [Clostridia bacterium]